MNGRVVIPIANERGELVAYVGRAIDETEPKYKFPSGFRKSEVLFNLNRVPTGASMVIVVEGFFDCMNVHQSGFPSVVALMGASMSEAQKKLLCQFKQIVLFLDGDNAGRQAMAAIAPELMSRTFVRVVELPDGEQPDQLTAEQIQAALAL